MKQRIIAFLIPIIALCITARSVSHAADSSSPRKIRMAFTSLSGSMIPPWMARSAGIFNKYGLDVEVISTPSGVEGMNALIAGELQFLQIAGGTTASAALGGADVMIVGTTIDTFVQNLVVRPEIEKPEQLKGKSVWCRKKMWLSCKSAALNPLSLLCKVIVSRPAFSPIRRSAAPKSSGTARYWTLLLSVFLTHLQV